MLPLLHIKNLSVDFINETGVSHAVKNIDFIVEKGKICGIVGESGSGKSVTSLAILRLLGKGAHFPSGEILFSRDGLNQVDLLKQEEQSMKSIRGDKIAMIFQEPMTSLNPMYTCGEQVMEAIRTHESTSISEAKHRTIELFNRVKLPDPANICSRYPHQLSGGQKQRVMIAMAMSGNPSLLICDEPTTALDVTVQKAVLQLLKDLQQETGMGVIFITHDLGVIAEIADSIVVMYKGAVIEKGEMRKVFEAPGEAYTKALLACRPSMHPKGKRLPVVADFMAEGGGRRMEDKGQKAEGKGQVAAAGKVLLEVRNLTVQFTNKTNFWGRPLSYTKAVDDVTFDVFEGETLGLVGESGCGKTTLGRALLRLVEPTAGSIRFSGTDLRALKGSGLKQFRRNIQIIFQDPYSSLNPSMTIGKSIGEPVSVHFPEISTRGRRELVMDLLEKVGLGADHYNRYPHEFSGGQRQRIVIARALALKPQFIICDESVSALDVSIQAQVLNLLSDLRSEFGFTTIFISHDLSVVRHVSDRIAVMNRGRIEEIGPADEIYHHPGSAYTRRLLESVPGGTR